MTTISNIRRVSQNKYMGELSKLRGRSEIFQICIFVVADLLENLKLSCRFSDFYKDINRTCKVLVNSAHLLYFLTYFLFLRS